MSHLYGRFIVKKVERRKEMTDATYTYDPYNFDAEDYTEQELYILFRDINTGVCVPEKSCQKFITSKELLQRDLEKQKISGCFYSGDVVGRMSW